MTVSISRSAFVATKAGQAVPLSQMIRVTVGGNPQYLVLSGLDRNEYTAAATDATGLLSDNAVTDSFADLNGDSRAIGIVFTYNAATGQYVNSTYGALTSLIYNASGSVNDLVNFSLYGFSSLALASAYANNPTDLMILADDGYATYLGSASVATEPSFTGSVPTQATPDSIAATALSFVGQAWNEDGCWVLASDIATEAGAALPVTSTVIGLPGQASGEWFVAYDGPVAASANWESQVHAGEVISFQTGSGGGHIVTVVSGAGSTAEIVDNVTYVNASGQVVNLAGDGSANDVTIAAPHLFSQELGGVAANSVVIYELDTPVVTADAATATLGSRATDSLAALFSVADPKGTGITEVQVYQTSGADALTVAGATSDPTSAAPLTASSLSAVTLDAAAGSSTDTLEVRAFNGAYWGDWTAETIVTAAQSPPTLAHQTPAQSWIAGQTVSLYLGGVFTDPQGQALSLSVSQSNGSALPSGLSFDAATETLTGTAPLTPETLGLQVTATDTGGLSAAEVFQATVAAAPGPHLAQQTPTQTWLPNSFVAFTLPSGTFSDPGQHLSYAAYQTSGSSVTNWLFFNAATDTLFGIVPGNERGSIGLAVVASNSAGASATDDFTVQFAGSTTGHISVGAAVASERLLL
jgi:hypothetical protein